MYGFSSEQSSHSVWPSGFKSVVGRRMGICDRGIAGRTEGGGQSVIDGLMVRKEPPLHGMTYYMMPPLWRAGHIE